MCSAEVGLFSRLAVVQGPHLNPIQKLLIKKLFKRGMLKQKSLNELSSLYSQTCPFTLSKIQLKFCYI